MKAKRIEKSELKEEIVYPCLMESEELGCVAIFTERSSGTVIQVDADSRRVEVGDASHAWDVRLFKKFEGKITLQND